VRHDGPIDGLGASLRRLRRNTRSWRHFLNLRDPLRVQRSARLTPEDRAPRRKRRHVLVDLIHEHCPSAGAVVVEVGAYRGDTSAHVHKYCPGVDRIYAVDIRKPEPERDRIANLERVTFLLGDSAARAGDFADASIDLVFVDADHAEASVRKDLEAWAPKVKPGGVISGHDYASRRHPGVKPAVDRFFAGHPHPLKLEANRVWWTIK
jgi:predicted O-methyltransferase YrrM